MWITGKATISAPSYAEVPRSGCENRIYQRESPEDRSFELEPLALFAAIARTSLTSPSPIELLLELVGATAIIAKHLRREPRGLFLENRNRVDYLRSTLAGQMGYAVAALFMEKFEGFSLFSHFEEQLATRLLRSASGSQEKTPDMFALNPKTREIVLLEAKGTLNDQNDQDVWSPLITSGYKKQICPWLDCSLGGLTIDRGFSVGTQINENDAALVKWVCTETPHGGHSRPRGVPSPSLTPLIAAHYARWLQKFGTDFWPLSDSLRTLESKLPDREVSLRRRRRPQDGEMYVFGPRFSFMPPLFTEFERHLGFSALLRGRPVSFGLHRDIFRALLRLSPNPQESSESTPQILAILEELDVRAAEDDQAIYSSDGTAVIVDSNQNNEEDDDMEEFRI